MQPEGKTLDAAAAPRLQARWTFSTDGAGGTGGFQSTPTIADGCVYAGTSTGWIFAVNADTGKLVWKKNLGEGRRGVFALTVKDGKVFANANGKKGPYAVALDQVSGDIEWQSPVLEKYTGASTQASSVVYNGILFVGISVPEGDPEARGSFVLVDAGTGEVLKKTHVIPDKDFPKYAGAGIWSTAAVDPETGHAYVGTGNPFNRGRDHRYANAIIKVDLNRGRRTFGEIVDAYKGDPDQYYPLAEILADTPACKAKEIPPTIDYPQCGQVDVDIGASPNLFVDRDGDKLVGVLQKSGIYHVVYADTMQKAWTTVVGAPCALCNAASSAYDGKSIYVAGAPGTVMYSLDNNSGAYKWASPIADGFHYQPVTVAKGVVYTTDTTGNLDIFDARTGAPMFSRPLSLDTGTQGDVCSTLGGGVAVARNQVYVGCDVGVSAGGWLIAYGHAG